jgi:hypothetical protein
MVLLLQPVSYLELVRYLGDVRSTGDKNHKLLLSSILPRLAQMEGLPASLTAQLLQLMGGSDDRQIPNLL